MAPFDGGPGMFGPGLFGLGLLGLGLLGLGMFGPGLFDPGMFVGLFLGPRISPGLVARTPRRRCGRMRGSEDAEGMVDTMSKRLEGASPVTARVSASAVEGW